MELSYCKQSNPKHELSQTQKYLESKPTYKEGKVNRNVQSGELFRPPHLQPPYMDTAESWNACQFHFTNNKMVVSDDVDKKIIWLLRLEDLLDLPDW